MSIHIEKKIDDILKQFKTELRAYNVVDEAGNVINKKAFAKSVDNSINKLNDLEKYIASEEGVFTDQYAANILYKTIQSLKDMKEYNSLNPNLGEENMRKRESEEEERLSKQYGLFNGIKKLFNKVKPNLRTERDSR